MPFSGRIKIKVIEARELKPTEFSQRHNAMVGRASQQMLIDPYVYIVIDDNYIDRSTTKQKTFRPIWNECFSANVLNAQNLLLTVFHDAAIPPDDFVANCTVPFDDLIQSQNQNGVYESDFWVCLTRKSLFFNFRFNLKFIMTSNKCIDY